MQNNIEEFSRANNDLNNLIAGTGIATIFVDLRLRIQRFTPAATKVINLIQTDIGRPVGHLASNLVNYNELVQDVETVLDTLASKEAEVQTREGLWYLMRILPYRTLENVIEGAVLTFVEVSAQKQAQEKLQRLSEAAEEAREYAESIVTTVSDPLVVLDADLRVKTANPAFLGGFKVDRHAINGQLLFDLDNRQWDIPELRKLLEEILPRQTTLTDFEMTHSFEHLGKRTMRLNAREVIQEGGRERLILLSIKDITQHVQAEEQANYHNALLQILSAAVISTDLELKILSWNKAAEAIYGWREDEVLGKSIAEVTGPEFPPGQPVEVRKQLFEAGYWQGEAVQSRQDGSSLNIHSLVSLVKDSDGRAIGTVAVIRELEKRAG